MPEKAMQKVWKIKLKWKPNGAKIGFKIASAADVEYQAIFDAKIVRKLISNQAQNR